MTRSALVVQAYRRDDGKVLREHRFPLEKGVFGTGSSPILDGGTLHLVRDVDSSSAVHAFDAASGEELWTTPRPAARANYATPYVWRHGAREELIVATPAVVDDRVYLRTAGHLWAIGTTK